MSVFVTFPSPWAPYPELSSSQQRVVSAAAVPCLLHLKPSVVLGITLFLCFPLCSAELNPKRLVPSPAPSRAGARTNVASTCVCSTFLPLRRETAFASFLPETANERKFPGRHRERAENLCIPAKLFALEGCRVRGPVSIDVSFGGGCRRFIRAE